jgi:asparagine N-glycosylation enzyme membrane subunit Stt3
MSVVNRPEVSRPLTWFYLATTILVVALGLVLAYFYVQMPQIVGIIGLVVIVAVGIIMVSLIASIYRTKYALTQKELVIEASILIGGTKRIPLETIESAERTLIPFGIRLFGATGYGGYYYFPNVGRAFMAITNFKDGVLIKTKQGNYLITPKNPQNFIEFITATAKPEKKKEL